jgi:hypothetical protein
MLFKCRLWGTKTNPVSGRNPLPNFLCKLTGLISHYSGVATFIIKSSEVSRYSFVTTLGQLETQSVILFLAWLTIYMNGTDTLFPITIIKIAEIR